MEEPDESDELSDELEAEHRSSAAGETGDGGIDVALGDGRSAVDDAEMRALEYLCGLHASMYSRERASKCQVVRGRDETRALE